jgi:hypothetical protein
VRRVVSLLLCLVLFGCATPRRDTTFQTQFDHFYPDDPQYVTKLYWDAYIKIMADPLRGGDLSAAISGDTSALKRYLLRASTEKDDLDGERGETYAYGLRFVLIRVGDQRFAAVLREFTATQREEVALSLDCLISRECDWFPETTSLYQYRWKRT